jgi:hypothetical protein
MMLIAISINRSLFHELEYAPAEHPEKLRAPSKPNVERFPQPHFCGTCILQLRILQLRRILQRGRILRESHFATKFLRLGHARCFHDRYMVEAAALAVDVTGAALADDGDSEVVFNARERKYTRKEEARDRRSFRAR